MLNISGWRMEKVGVGGSCPEQPLDSPESGIVLWTRPGNYTPRPALRACSFGGENEQM